MWQLQLLQDVIPVIYMMVEEAASELDNGSRGIRSTELRLKDWILACLGHIMNIKEAMDKSRGQWRPGLNEGILTLLLWELEICIQVPRSSASLTKASSSRYETRILPQLHELRTRIAHQADKRGVTASSMVRNAPGSGEAARKEQEMMIQQYRENLGVSIPLFRRERAGSEKQESQTMFLKVIEEACQHLLKMVYLEPPQPSDTRQTLSKHPSNRFRTLAESVHGLLGQNWNSGSQSGSAAEARLSLTLFDPQADTVPQQGDVPNGGGTMFEILLPVCERGIDWKVAKVWIVTSKDVLEAGSEAREVRSNLLDMVRQRNIVGVKLWANPVAQKLWSAPPPPLGEAYQHSGMESLYALLGDNEALASQARLSSYKKRDRLALAYILATSVLYLYPGPWVGTECCWSSEKIWFTRCARTEPPQLEIQQPYLSADLLHRQENPKESLRHPHRPIMALGIMLLEIATRTKFEALCREVRSGGGSSVGCQAAMAASDTDGNLALEVLQRLESQGRSPRVPTYMGEAVRACLRLGSDRSLVEDGPLSHDVLTRVLAPLAAALEKEQAGEEQGGKEQGGEEQAGKEQGGEEQDGEEQATDPAKLKLATKWRSLYQNMLDRVYPDERGTRRRGDRKRVRIAILDSGLKLSDNQRAKYFNECKIKYRDWVDDPGLDETWKSGTDNVGHGTHLSTLLGKVAPEARIFVARVFKSRGPKMDEELPNVAKAILHAVDEWHVDVIVMSFGWDATPRLHKNIGLCAVRAIRYAANEGVAMFAAASNDGKNKLRGAAWPARMEEVICVHSFDGHGNPSGFTPRPDGNNTLAVLGEGIKSAWPERLRDKGERCRNGTSCAAVIAAAMAAVVLDYARAFLDDEEWLELRRVGGLRRMFNQLKNDKTSGYTYMLPWETFSADGSEEWIQEEIRITVGLSRSSS